MRSDRPTADHGSLEQAVARALSEIPHDAGCDSVLGHDDDGFIAAGHCDCSREQRIAARVAAAIEAYHTVAWLATVKAPSAGEPPLSISEAARLCEQRARIGAALWALSHEEGTPT